MDPERTARACATTMLAAWSAWALTGCAAGFALAPELRAPPAPLDAGRAARAHLSALTALDPSEASAQLAASAPGSPPHLDTSARLASLRADAAAERAALLALVALRDGVPPGLRRAAFARLARVPATVAEARLEGETLHRLALDHPEPWVRDHAALRLAELSLLHGDREAAERWAARAPSVPLRWIGGWDNDQGKAFDMALPPETDGVDLDAEYPGAVGPVTWRRPAAEPLPGRPDLAAVLRPAEHAVAYGTAALRLTSAQPVALRLTTSSPVKVWIDGRLVLATREIEGGGLVDGVIVRLALEAGPHRLLVKSATARHGPWRCALRVTAPEGGAVPGLMVLPDGARTPSDGPVADGPPVAGTRDLLAAAGGGSLPPGPWGRLIGAELADALGFRHVAVRGLEGWPAAGQGAAELGLVATAAFARALRRAGDAGRAADQVERLAAALNGPTGPGLAAWSGLALSRAAWFERRGRLPRARAAVDALVDAMGRGEPVMAPATRAAIWGRVARLDGREGWGQDQCRHLANASESRPGSLRAGTALARCWAARGYRERARAAMTGLHRALPGHPEPALWLVEDAERRGELGEAVDRLERWLELRPTEAAAWLRMADLQRRLGRFAAALATVEQAVALAPGAAAPRRRLGDLAYEQGHRERAVAAWREALERAPQDDRLARRLARLAPDEDGPWRRDVPDAAALDEAVGRAIVPGTAGGDASLLFLVDDEVTRVHADGGRSGVVTQVIQALDPSGRDRVTSLRLQQPGRKRLLAAYAVGVDGRRVEANALRDGALRFRGLDVGAVVVLQYRYDAGAQPFLARYYSRDRVFQRVAARSLEARWVLWTDADEALHVQAHGAVAREEAEVAGARRVVWRTSDVPPLVPEADMPTLLDVAMHVLVSTVPSWETFVRWEEALLHDAFRESPGIVALAEELRATGASGDALVRAIHRWVMEEVRYDQDYESTIAGVKPHAAPTVLERRYGDCKDKSVLFITLARRLGLDARFAVLRTRPAGPTFRDVPFQQFNHAIVYVPAQPDRGVLRARFYDPTADMLDLDVLRPDDAGVPALVFDVAAGTGAWVDVPFQGSDAHRVRYHAELALDAAGTATGTLAVEARGLVGGVVRQVARNAAMFSQAAQALASSVLPSAVVEASEAVEVSRLDEPARVLLTVRAPDAVQPGAGGRQLPAPVEAFRSLGESFRQPSRAHPLVLGHPEEVRYRLRVTLPKGWRGRALPSEQRVDAPCFSVSREVAGRGRTLEVTWRQEVRCARVEADAYEVHRVAAQQADRLITEPLTLGR